MVAMTLPAPGYAQNFVRGEGHSRFQILLKILNTALFLKWCCHYCNPSRTSLWMTRWSWRMAVLDGSYTLHCLALDTLALHGQLFISLAHFQSCRFQGGVIFYKLSTPHNCSDQNFTSLWRCSFTIHNQQLFMNCFQTGDESMLKHNVYKIGFEVLMAVSTKMAVFWIVAPFSLKHWYTCTRLHGTTTQKTAIIMFTY
jgi:hypothetical protein